MYFIVDVFTQIMDWAQTERLYPNWMALSGVFFPCAFVVALVLIVTDRRELSALKKRIQSQASGASSAWTPPPPPK